MTESLLRTVRASYDAIAADYAALFDDEPCRPLDRALLAAFAELVRDSGAGPVADLGCGPGRVTAHLHSLGVEVFGVDLSPRMVALARAGYPHLRFVEGRLDSLGVADGSLGGVVSWYSIIHTPPERLPAVLAEFHRVLVPGGHLLLAFQVGDEPLRLREAFGRAVELDFLRWRPDRVAEALERARFSVTARTLRQPDGTERVPQACLLARRSGAGKPPEAAAAAHHSDVSTRK